MDLKLSINRRSIFIFLLSIISFIALFPEIDMPFYKIDLFNLIGPLAGIALILYNYKKTNQLIIKYRKEIIIIISFFVILLISSILSYDRKIAFKYYIKYLEILIIFFGILMHINSDKDVEGVLKLYIIYTVFFAMAGFFIYLFPSFFQDLLFMHTIEDGLQMRNASLMSNPNTYGFYSVIICISAFVLHKQNVISKSLATVAITAALFGIIYAKSRNALLTMTISMFMLMFIIDKHNRRKIICGMTIFIIIFLFAWYIFFSSKIDKNDMNCKSVYNIVMRSTLKPRLLLWRGAMKSFVQNPILGTGPYVYVHHHLSYTKGTRFYYLMGKKNTTGSYNAHNIFFELLAESGLAGLIIFSTIFVLIYKLFRKRKYYIAFPLLTYFIGQVFDCFLYDYFLNVFFASLLSIAIYENRKINDIAQ